MSWLQKLHDTYEQCQFAIGKGQDGEIPLLPICHTTNQAQIEIILNEDGVFNAARVVPKREARTIIPCTEKSGNRTSGLSPHPLADKLQYIAADYKQYGGRKKHDHINYYELLSDWARSPFSHAKVVAIHKYIERGQVIKDLVDYHILYTDDRNQLIKQWDKSRHQEIPEIFRVMASSEQAEALVRWIVEIPGVVQSRVWDDTEVHESWIQYNASLQKKRALCYVTGELQTSARLHPAKLRNDGDKARIISSNDTAGFTFRGRFHTAEQACGVGFEVTHKAHNALRWLIGRQGYRNGEQAIVAWATKGAPLPDLMADSYSILNIDEGDEYDPELIDTAQEFALKLNRTIAGYSTTIGSDDDIVVMTLDAATVGRLSVSYYRELRGSEFLERIKHWHETCAWVHQYRKKEQINPDTGRKEKKRVTFVGTPAPRDIAEAAYGRSMDDKLRKSVVEQILHSIIEGQSLSGNLVESAVRRACNRVGMEDWEWNKTLSIACALYRKLKEKENWNMSLDEACASRDYLYGRLLAVADNLEREAHQLGGEQRPTHAARYMQRFADRPYSTWTMIYLNLQFYIDRLGKKRSYRYLKLIEAISDLFDYDDYKIDKKLSGEFLLGYHCQRSALYQKKASSELSLLSNSEGVSYDDQLEQ